VSRTPEPRPALQKAPDGAVHPAAAPRTSAPKHLHAAPQAPTVASSPTAQGSGGHGSSRHGVGQDFKPGDLRARRAKGKASSEPLVALKVDVPKSLRKSARKKAERNGDDLGVVVTSLLRAWVDG
jgi:hypothetical protein